MTKSLFDFEIDETLVGITTDFIHPAIENHSPVRVGGPKDFRLGAIVDLQPDLGVTHWEDSL